MIFRILKVSNYGDLAAQHNLHQIIDAPTHVLPNSASCIDLIFISARDLIIDSGVLPSLFPRCHHHLVFAKLNFKVSFPPAYKRRVWDFSRANIPAIQQAITGINWNTAFIGLNVDERVSFLTDCVLNVFQNFVPNMVITVRNKDALWMTPEIKKMILEKAKIYRRYVKHGRNAVDYLNLRDITARCRTLIKKKPRMDIFLDLATLLITLTLGRRNIGRSYTVFLTNGNHPKSLQFVTIMQL